MPILDQRLSDRYYKKFEGKPPESILKVPYKPVLRALDFLGNASRTAIKDAYRARKYGVVDMLSEGFEGAFEAAFEGRETPVQDVSRNILLKELTGGKTTTGNAYADFGIDLMVGLATDPLMLFSFGTSSFAKPLVSAAKTIEGASNINKASKIAKVLNAGKDLIKTTASKNPVLSKLLTGTSKTLPEIKMGTALPDPVVSGMNALAQTGEKGLTLAKSAETAYPVVAKAATVEESLGIFKAKAMADYFTKKAAQGTAKVASEGAAEVIGPMAKAGERILEVGKQAEEISKARKILGVASKVGKGVAKAYTVGKYGTNALVSASLAPGDENGDVSLLERLTWAGIGLGLTYVSGNIGKYRAALSPVKASQILDMSNAARTVKQNGGLLNLKNNEAMLQNFVLKYGSNSTEILHQAKTMATKVATTRGALGGLYGYGMANPDDPFIQKLAWSAAGATTFASSGYVMPLIGNLINRMGDAGVDGYYKLAFGLDDGATKFKIGLLNNPIGADEIVKKSLATSTGMTIEEVSERLFNPKYFDTIDDLTPIYDARMGALRNPVSLSTSYTLNNAVDAVDKQQHWANELVNGRERILKDLKPKQRLHAELLNNELRHQTLKHRNKLIDQYKKAKGVNEVPLDKLNEFTKEANAVAQKDAAKLAYVFGEDTYKIVEQVAEYNVETMAKRTRETLGRKNFTPMRYHTAEVYNPRDFMDIEFEHMARSFDDEYIKLHFASGNYDDLGKLIDPKKIPSYMARSDPERYKEILKIAKEADLEKKAAYEGIRDSFVSNIKKKGTREKVLQDLYRDEITAKLTPQFDKMDAAAQVEKEALASNIKMKGVQAGEAEMYSTYRKTIREHIAKLREKVLKKKNEVYTRYANKHGKEALEKRRSYFDEGFENRFNKAKADYLNDAEKHFTTNKEDFYINSKYKEIDDALLKNKEKIADDYFKETFSKKDYFKKYMDTHLKPAYKAIDDKYDPIARPIADAIKPTEEGYKLARQDYANKMSYAFLNKTERDVLAMKNKISILKDAALSGKGPFQNYNKFLKEFDRQTSYIKVNLLGTSKYWLTTQLYDNILKSSLEAGLPAGVHTAMAQTKALPKMFKSLSDDFVKLFKEGKLDIPTEEIAELEKLGVYEKGMSLYGQGEAVKKIDDIVKRGYGLATELKANPRGIWGHTKEYIHKFQDLEKAGMEKTFLKMGQELDAQARIITYRHLLNNLIDNGYYAYVLKNNKLRSTGIDVAKWSMDQTKELAAQMVKEAFFDYRKVKHFENALAKRIIPFWTFTARNLPYWFNKISTPGSTKGLAAIDRIRTSIGSKLALEQEQGLPSYRQAVPFRSIENGDATKDKYVDLSRMSSFYDIFQPTKGLTAVNPIIKNTAEGISNYDWFMGKPLSPTTGLSDIKEKNQIQLEAGKTYMYDRGRTYYKLQEKLGIDLGMRKKGKNHYAVTGLMPRLNKAIELLLPMIGGADNIAKFVDQKKSLPEFMLMEGLLPVKEYEQGYASKKYNQMLNKIQRD